MEATEIDYADGKGRMRWAVFEWGDGMVGQYFSATWGSRSLRTFQKKDLQTALEQVRADEAELAKVGKVSVQPCKLAASFWCGPLDTFNSPCSASASLVGLGLSSSASIGSRESHDWGTTPGNGRRRAN
ncbi:hypothetical protein TVH25_11810 [Rhodococcus sp. 7Tela_A2]|uniref:hypothetical protein n=1 Tax=Rhodococcus sp. 7Tela_A2 TaxID=3093744 RepID=UPI003BB4F1CB